jgi:hypothetical protein
MTSLSSFLLLLLPLLWLGEGHGWRKAESIRRALRLELSFYGAVFGFSPEPEEVEDVPLENRETLLRGEHC